MKVAMVPTCNMRGPTQGLSSQLGLCIFKGGAVGKKVCVRTSSKLPQVTGIYGPNLLIEPLFLHIL